MQCAHKQQHPKVQAGSKPYAENRYFFRHYIYTTFLLILQRKLLQVYIINFSIKPSLLSPSIVQASHQREGMIVCVRMHICNIVLMLLVVLQCIYLRIFF